MKLYSVLQFIYPYIQTWLNCTLEHQIGAEKNKPLKLVQGNKIGLQREQAILKLLGVGGHLWSGSEYSPDTPEIFIWIMHRFTPSEQRSVQGVGRWQSLISNSVEEHSVKEDERGKRDWGIKVSERDKERNKDPDMRWGRQMEVHVYWIL